MELISAALGVPTTAWGLGCLLLLLSPAHFYQQQAASFI